jgi:hypothetical protein
MTKLSKKQLGAMGTKITTEAKKIRKAHPSKKWTDCIKAAGKSFKKSK